MPQHGRKSFFSLRATVVREGSDIPIATPEARTPWNNATQPQRNNFQTGIPFPTKLPFKQEGRINMHSHQSSQNLSLMNPLSGNQ